MPPHRPSFLSLLPLRALRSLPHPGPWLPCAICRVLTRHSHETWFCPWVSRPHSDHRPQADPESARPCPLLQSPYLIRGIKIPKSIGENRRSGDPRELLPQGWPGRIWLQDGGRSIQAESGTRLDLGEAWEAVSSTEGDMVAVDPWAREARRGPRGEIGRVMNVLREKLEVSSRCGKG